MVYSYAIDKEFLSVNDENELELWLAKANHFFSTTAKRTILLDCNLAGMSNALVKKYLELRDIFDNDQILIKQLESLWTKYLHNTFYFVNVTCDCDNPYSCDISKNVTAINSSDNYKLNFFITYKSKIAINEVQKVDLHDFYNTQIMKECEKTEYNEDQPADLSLGEACIIKNFSSIFSICSDEITIIDRNVFERWNDNYKSGLIIFASAIEKINPELTLTIITRKQSNHVTEENTSAHDILRYMNDTISGDSVNIKVKIKLCDKKDGKFDHERYILFDEIIGAKLGKGLDTFVPNTQGDGVVITYCSTDEVITKKRNAFSTLINDGDFKQFTNRE